MTGDGRVKPDIVAPGEKIISCAAGKAKTKAVSQASGMSPAECDYVEDSGTSMSAPHVSGVIAAFLSIRPEFIGQPEKVKEIFLSTATDLKRERYFQGTAGRSDARNPVGLGFQPLSLTKGNCIHAQPYRQSRSSSSVDEQYHSEHGIRRFPGRRGRNRRGK
jgi:subtilisin family serine protease